MKYLDVQLSDTDLEFLIETASPHATDMYHLKQALREDAILRHAYLLDEQVAQRVIHDDEVLIRISPRLFFEILLRQAVEELTHGSYTMERSGRMVIPVFDSDDLAEFLREDAHVLYLADMLASFTKINSYTIVIRLRKGFWREIRFNDLDMYHLMGLCAVVEEEYRLALYKRIGDICLFTSSMFPEYVDQDYRYPVSRQRRPQVRGKIRIAPNEYEEQGRRFYRLAAEHPAAHEVEMSAIFEALRTHFTKAQKPLGFIADHYLHYRKQKVFG
jgi:hypothetical protein